MNSDKVASSLISIDHPGIREIISDRELLSDVIDRLVEKISNIQKRIDRLFLALLVISLYGFVYLNSTEQITIPFTDVEVSGKLFNMVVSCVLLINFGVIGSLLIDYFSNRAILDFYGGHYLFEKLLVETNEEIQDVEAANTILERNPNPDKQVGSNKEPLSVSRVIKDLISRMYVRASIYEWMYRLGYTDRATGWKRLWLPVSNIILASFFVSHLVAYLNLFKGLGTDSILAYILAVIGGIILALLYLTFIISSKRASVQLGEVVRNSVLFLTVLFVIFVLVSWSSLVDLVQPLC